MQTKTRSRNLMIAAMAIFGTIAPLVRQIPLSSGEVALWRAVLASLLIGLYLLTTKQKLVLAHLKKELILLLFSGMAMGANWVFLFEAYRYTTVSTATLSYYFAPVIVMLVSPLLFREKLSGKQIVCFVMSTVGVVLITGLTQLSGGREWIGIAFGLGAAVLYAAVVLINKFIRSIEGIHRTFLQFVASLVVLVPYVLLSGGTQLGSMDGTGWLCLLIVGLLHTGVTYCLYFTSLRNLPGQQAAILSYIDPLVAVLISVTLLGETMNAMQVVGGLLILGFTLWNELTPKTAKS